MLNTEELHSIIENNDFNYSLLTDLNDINNIELFKLCYNFLSSNYLINKEILVSLSGGVDSMVLLSILNKINPNKVTALHINYNNRPETNLEEQFLNDICKNCNINFIVKKFEHIKRGEINRNKYEEYTKSERYKFYNENVTKKNTKGVFLAHHRNDEQENIFSNLLKGKSLIDLSALKSNTIINNVEVLRPFVNITKEKIFDFAHKNKIPYFKDTTPDWSNRGKLRRKVFPVLKEIYNLENNLDKIGIESLELNNLIITKIINKYMENSIHINDGEIIISNLQEYYDMPLTFWSYIFVRIFHNLNQNMISNKSLKNLVYKINNKFEGKVNLRKDVICNLNSSKLILILS